ncbi:type VI secretion system tip protein VgrG [Pseudomonas entomophila]|uniref:type VI secretion system Vgr family protein n=1 Tax=Pseudomonas entomophila TaxID=312306 RepID=UPI00200DD287|nr:type VI secretion system tip protein VgrG [Pseudomonas entomophila]
MFESLPPDRLRFHVPAVQPELQVLKFSGDEGISRLFRFELELVSENARLPLERMLNQPAFLAFDGLDCGIHGVISRFRQGVIGDRLTHYHARLEPRLARLKLRTNQRVFQQRTVAQIIGQVLEEHGLLGDCYRFLLEEPYPPREYCVQYGESDLGFIERLCQEDGIHYHFTHARQGHGVVFADHQSHFPRLGRALGFHPPSGLQADTQVASQFGVSVRTTVNQVELRDHDFRKAALPLAYPSSTGEAQVLPLEHYAYPGGLRQTLDQQRGASLSKRALQRCRFNHCLAEGASDAAFLLSGHLLQLTDHPREAWNDLWLLTHVHHEGRQPQVLEEHAEADAQARYSNTFNAIPWDVLFRPPLARPRPQVPGCQVARVTGPPGEEVYCDALGRVKVQFHWDREGRGDAHTSCWLRVLSSWSGDRYGAVTLPRVGMAVVVSFLDNDPDQPVVSGCLPDSLHPPPYALPEYRSRTVLRSRSLGGGGGYNELAMEDRAGQELLYLRAQRDYERQVGNDSLEEIGGQREVRVKGPSRVTLEAEEHRTVGGHRQVLVRASDHLVVEEGSQTRVGTVLVQHAGRQVQVSADGEVVVEGGASITLKVGGQHLVVNGAGIFCSSPIQIGGAPAASQAVVSLPPELAGSQGPAALPKVVAPVMLALVAASKQADQDYCPLCEACANGQCLPLGGVR